MPKRAKKEEIDRWRGNYLRRRKDHSNKEMAQKLGVDEGNLSAYGLGTKKTNGKPTNPGEEFIKNFYMEYPPLPESHEGNETDSNADKKQPGYNHEDQSSFKAEEGQLRYLINLEDPVAMRNELLTVYKRNDEFLRSEFSKASTTSQRAVAAFDKMAESNLILSRKVVSSPKKSNPAQENSL